MKKLTSILCAMVMLCGLYDVAIAATNVSHTDMGVYMSIHSNAYGITMAVTLTAGSGFSVETDGRVTGLALSLNATSKTNVTTFSTKRFMTTSAPITGSVERDLYMANSGYYSNGHYKVDYNSSTQKYTTTKSWYAITPLTY